MNKSEIKRLKKLNIISKIRSVILSCETYEQLDNAKKWAHILLEQNWSYENGGTVSEFCEIRNIIYDTTSKSKKKINGIVRGSTCSDFIG